MARKRLTQLFPWLLPLRRRQRLFCFYLKMRFDGNRYAAARTADPLPRLLCASRCPLYNRQTGFPMVYQDNKVHNLKLAAATLDGLVIRPRETFSFWRLVRYADKDTPYKDGLTTVDGALVPQPGGGLCQMSNLLFWLFLHTPLTIVERHGHGVKDFPEPPSDAPLGVDATVSEGWLDLKVRNDTPLTFQLRIRFDAEHILGEIFCDPDEGLTYRVVNGETLYCRGGGRLLESVDVIQDVFDDHSGARIASRLLYRNICEIGYPLPAGTPVVEMG